MSDAGRPRSPGAPERSERWLPTGESIRRSLASLGRRAGTRALGRDAAAARRARVALGRFFLHPELDADFRSAVPDASDRFAQALLADAERLRPVTDLVRLGEADQVAVVTAAIRLVFAHDLSPWPAGRHCAPLAG